MPKIIEQHLQLDRIPQAPPGAAKHPIHKLPPQLTDGGFAALAHLTEHELVLRGALSRNQQPRRVFGQGGRARGAPIPQVAQRDTAIDPLHQGQGWVAVVPVARRQDDIEHPSATVAQPVQLEAKEPPFAGFANIRALIAQPSHPPVSAGGAERNGLTINQLQPRSARGMATGSSQQLPDLGLPVVQPRQPLFVGRQVRKGCPPILHHQTRGLLESGHLQDALPQRHRQDCGGAEVGLGVGRVPPLGHNGLGFQEFVHKAVDHEQSVVYAIRHRSSSSRGRIKGCASILPFRRGLTTLLFQLKTGVE